MATLHDAIQYTLLEEFLPTIQSVSAFMDPVFPKIKASSRKVVNRGLGRGSNVNMTFVIGVAGGGKFTNTLASNVISGPSNFNMFDTPNTYQSLDETVAPAYFTSTISLIEYRGNFFLPQQFLRLDQYASSIGSVVGDMMKGVATLVAQHECAQFWADDTYMALGDIGDTSATVTDVSGDTSAISVDMAGTGTSGKIHQFLDGMLIDIWDSTGTTQRNDAFLLAIDHVDTLNRTMTIRRLDGGTFQTTTTLNGGVTYAGAGGDNDIIVIKDSLSQGPTNINSWIKTSGTLFGINLALRPSFKSYVPSAESAALSESLLNKRYYRFGEGYPGVWLDTAITTNGCLLGLIDNLDGFVSGSNSQDGRMRFDRNGEMLKPNLGFSSFNYSFNGRPVTIYTTQYCPASTWYGIQLANGNLVRYVPSGIPGAGSDGEIGSELEFTAPIEGVSSSIFAHATVAGKLTDFVQAPFLKQWNVLPSDPRSMKLTGITEISA